MQTTPSTPHRLLAYGSLALGSTTILATQADAATIVDINSNTYNTGLSGIGTISLSTSSFNQYGKTYTTSRVAVSGGISVPGPVSFKRGADATAVSTTGSNSLFNYAFRQVTYNPPPSMVSQNGAVLNSSDNWFYAIDDVDTSQRLWLQFDFGNNDGTFSIVKAVIPGAGETLNNAAAASAVPEPSALVLLSLGATGLPARRRRQAA